MYKSLDHFQVRLEADDGGEAQWLVPHGPAVVRGGHRVQQHRLRLLVRRLDADPARSGGVGGRRPGGEQRLVDAVPGHQLLRLGGQCLRLLGEAGRLGLGEQRADAGEHARLGSGTAVGTGTGPGTRLPRGLVEGFEGRQAQQQAVQLQNGGRVREAVGARWRAPGLGFGRFRGELVQLRGPAGTTRAVVGALRADQRRRQAYVYVLQLAPHDPDDVGGLPAAPPCRRHELPAAPGEFFVRCRVRGQQGGTRVEGGVGLGVQGGPEGAFDGAGGSAAHSSIVPRGTDNDPDTQVPVVVAPALTDAPLGCLAAVLSGRRA